MSAGGIVLTDFAPTAADFRMEALAGLHRRPRRLPSKFFYDERGSALFDRICELPEYYLTRTETGILQRNLEAIREFSGPRCMLVELGSGNSRKTRQLLAALDSPAAYVPIDISRTHLERAALQLQHDYPLLEILPVCADYAQTIRLPSAGMEPPRRVFFFPGSTIGNLEPVGVTDFLRHIASWGEPGDRLIVGVDLVKPREVLEPAYNDSGGVTAAFNLNLLVRANRELGANFNLEEFSHDAVYDQAHGRIEMHLISSSARPQVVAIDGVRLVFEPGERILTEYSYKYRPAQFAQLADDAGWLMLERWTDPREWFGVFALELQSPGVI